MTKDQWNAFTSFRDDFRAKCAEWARDAGALPDRAATESAVGDAAARGWLAELQKGAAEADHNPAYPLETPVVYNQALDSIAETDDIRLLVIGDNPGKDEQLLKNRRYLVGQAGKLGAGFFRANLELEVDFRKNAVILNKTPIHTAKTKQLACVITSYSIHYTKLYETPPTNTSPSFGTWTAPPSARTSTSRT